MNFDSPLKFAEFLLKVADKQKKVEAPKTLEIAGKVLKSKAKSYIGHRQNSIGDKEVGAEWDDLADTTKENKQRLVDSGSISLSLNKDYNPLMLSGEMYRSIDYTVDNSTFSVTMGSTSKIAPYQEFGTSRIPPRPFIGRAAYELSPKIAEMFGACFVSGFINGNKISDNIGREIGYHQDISE